MASSDMAGSRAFWTEHFGHWPPTPEEVAAELHDWYVALHEVPKVYGELTGWRFTKPNTLAAVILEAAREDRARDDEAHALIMDCLARFVERRQILIDTKEGAEGTLHDYAETQRAWLASYDAECALVAAYGVVAGLSAVQPAPGGDVNREAIDALNRMGRG